MTGEMRQLLERMKVQREKSHLKIAPCSSRKHKALSRARARNSGFRVSPPTHCVIFSEQLALRPALTEKLAPLSKATVKAWMEAIWKLLLANYPAPEENTRLKPFGGHKGRKTCLAHGKSLPKTEAANIRAGIRDALLKYLYRLLPDK
jgi:hypothetical protein